MERANPYSIFNFRVEMESGVVVGTFSEVSGLDSEQGIIEYRTGDEATVMRKIPGLRKHSNVVLKRGIVGDIDLAAWRREVEDGIGDLTDEEGKTSVSVHLLDEKREKQLTWKLTKAWPCKWVGPGLAAGKNESAIETLELAHEGIESIKV